MSLPKQFEVPTVFVRGGRRGSIFEVVLTDIGAFQFTISGGCMITHLFHIHRCAIFMN
jgi:hypothetical protein